ncbi:hypothetical protein F2Q69_00006619 [Brassica cretica]|uniref:Uncharacterized protein n=1 Tax=Brassica cretica TaxID=69181 RepID=A0A8S9PI82_BRACR|nr:hypothetical protein F2Q69_00006619 [Brassica cretica]
MITSSRRATVVKLEPSSSLQGKKLKSGGVTTRPVQQSADIARSAENLATALSNLNLKVFPQDGSVLPIGDPSETVSQLYHLGERLSNEGSMVLREEIEDLKHQVSEEKDQRMAWELEICDLKDKLKELEKVAEVSSADALATSQKNQEVEEGINVLKAAVETFMLEMDLAKALEQYKVVIWEEARNKGVPPPTFEDEPAIPLVSELDVDSSAKPGGSPACIYVSYLISPLVGVRCSSEFERSPDGGMNEMAIFEAGFKGFIPSLIAEVSAYFGFAPSQFTPLSWRTLICIQVLGEFHGIEVPHGVLGDIWVHLELKRGEKGDHWTSSAWERPHRSDTVKSL